MVRDYTIAGGVGLRMPFGAILLIVILGACSSSGGPLSIDDDGGRVELSTGEEVELILHGNPTTGYTWVVAEMPAVVEQLGEPEFVPESDLIGAGGEFHFRFVGREPGTGRLVLNYERPFEQVAPQDTFEIEITVK